MAMNENEYKDLVSALIYTAQGAGELIMRYRDSGQEVTFKEDGSPVTPADRAAEELILNDLAGLMPGVAAIGEESAAAFKDAFDPDQPFFLVDPVDGTRGFIKGGKEFSVNIGYIENRKPVFGLIYAPAFSKLYFTRSPEEAVRANMAPVRGQSIDDLQPVPLKVRATPGHGLVAVVSRTHMNEDTRSYMARLPITETKNVSSSLKFMAVAEGSADLYPRLAPTMEWDTAAGHAIVTAAGGHVVMEDGSPLMYGKTATGLVNPGFIAWGAGPSELDSGTAKV